MQIAAAPLTARDRGRLALGVASLLAPLLDLDTSPHGQHRASELRMLLATVQSSTDDPTTLRTAVDTLEASEELVAEDEPDGPAAFRVDFAAALLYALRALHGSDDDYKWTWSRATDSITFLVEYVRRAEEAGRG